MYVSTYLALIYRYILYTYLAGTYQLGQFFNYYFNFIPVIKMQDIFYYTYFYALIYSMPLSMSF